MSFSATPPRGWSRGRLSPTPQLLSPGSAIFSNSVRIASGAATRPILRLLLDCWKGDPPRPSPCSLTDEPYNVKVAGNATRGDHREFAMASGEMTDAQCPGL